MEASQMLDVVHYLFEEDSVYTSREHIASSSEMRKQLYENLYNTNYRYYVDVKAYDSDGKNGGRKYIDDNEFNPADQPFDPMQQSETKPFVQPTELKENAYLPYGPSLDAPLG
jgi:hypothetical protein